MRDVYELNIVLTWDVVLDDLRKLATAVTRTNDVNLSVNRMLCKDLTLDVKAAVTQNCQLWQSSSLRITDTLKIRSTPNRSLFTKLIDHRPVLKQLRLKLEPSDPSIEIAHTPTDEL